MPRVLRVLVAEDDEACRKLLEIGLTLEGFEVEGARDGMEAVVAFDSARHDAVIVDLMMPRGSGMSVLRALRRMSDVPVVLTSGFSDSAHRVVALEAGADAFIPKPFEPREMALCIRNLVEGRPGPVATEPTIHHGPLEIRPEARAATLAGRPIELTAKELDLLIVLAESPGKVFSRAELLSRVWHSNPDWQSIDTVTEHIYRLRQKLPTEPSGLIQTVRGAGYRLAPVNPPVCRRAQDP